MATEAQPGGAPAGHAAIGFAWLGLGLSLCALQSFMAFAGHPLLGLAGLHALTIGFFTSTLVAMASRVTLGHSGGQLVADSASWRIFLGLQTVAIVRVAGEFGPAHITPISLLAALIWFGALLVFAWLVSVALNNNPAGFFG